MTRSAAWSLLLVLVCASSCVVWYGTDYMPAAHVKKILAREGTSEPLMGRITPAFEPARGGELAKASNFNFALAYLGLRGGKVCFYTTAQATKMAGDAHGQEDADAYVRKTFTREVFVFEARESLDDLSASGWPQDPPTQLDSLEVTLHGQQHVYNVHGFEGENRGTHLFYDVELCGPAPKVTASSRYLTVMRLPRKQLAGLGGGEPSLLAWAVDNAAVAAGELRDPPAASPAAAAAAAPAAADDLGGVLARDGRFRVFLAALASSGLDQVLASSKEPLTVFAPTDAAFTALGETRRKALLADPARLKDVLQNHLVVGAYQTAMFGTAARPSRLKTLNGKTVRVRSEKGKVLIEKSRVITEDVSADGGMIQVVDGVIEL